MRSIFAPMIKHNDIIEESLRRNSLQRPPKRVNDEDLTPFERWAVENYHITYEKTLRLNKAQKELLAQFETARENGQKLSFAVPHASKLGITTFCEAYIYWLQNVAGISDNVAMFYPDAKSKRSGKYRFYRNANANLHNFNVNTRRVKHLTGNSVTYNTDCTINAYYTLRQVNHVRNLSPRYVLYADAAKLTPRKYKEEYLLRNRLEPLYAAYISARPSTDGAITVFEGNTDTCSQFGFWFDLLNEPQTLNFTKLFLPWHVNENNKLHLDQSVKDFYNSLNDYEYGILWKELKLTLEQIYWYRRTTSYIGDKSQIPKIYPSTEEEARTRLRTTVSARPGESYITIPTFDNVHIKEYQRGQPPNIYSKAVLDIKESPPLDNIFVSADSAPPEKLKHPQILLSVPTTVPI